MLFGVIKINCDMCGRDTQLFKADIEGTILNVCGNCSRFGKIIETLRRERTEIFKKKEVKGVSAKVITAAMLGGDCYPTTPIGINLPNANWIRHL